MFRLKILFIASVFMLSIGHAKENLQKEIPSGINYFEGTAEEAFSNATKTGKYIFIDFYADWCAPCKKMDKETFTDKNVIEKLNKNFISVKVDGENPRSRFYEDLVLNLEGYPTMQILNSDGQILDELIGYASAEQLMEFISDENISNHLKLRESIEEDVKEIISTFCNAFEDIDLSSFKNAEDTNAKKALSLLAECNKKMDKLGIFLKQYNNVIEFKGNLMTEVENICPDAMALVLIMFTLREGNVLD